MTVEVKELTINVSMAKDPDKCPEEGDEGGLATDDKAEIISSCVDQVLRVIKSSEER